MWNVFWHFSLLSPSAYISWKSKNPTKQNEFEDYERGASHINGVKIAQSLDYHSRAHEHIHSAMDIKMNHFIHSYDLSAEEKEAIKCISRICKYRKKKCQSIVSMQTNHS